MTSRSSIKTRRKPRAPERRNTRTARPPQAAVQAAGLPVCGTGTVSRQNTKTAAGFAGSPDLSGTIQRLLDDLEDKPALSRRDVHVLLDLLKQPAYGGLESSKSARRLARRLGVVQLTRAAIVRAFLRDEHRRLSLARAYGLSLAEWLNQHSSRVSDRELTAWLLASQLQLNATITCLRTHLGHCRVIR